MIGLTILGSTGSIGVNTLDVIARHPGEFRVVALSGNRNVSGLTSQCLEYCPEYAVMHDPDAAAALQRTLQAANSPTRVLSGMEGLQTVAALPQNDYVMAAIVGAAGLLPTLDAVRTARRVLLANKEALVMAGALFMDEVRRYGTELLPIDSEHNALFQCLSPGFTNGLSTVGVERLLLTGSGGPFRELPLGSFDDVTPEQACAHPNWNMGKKISVDSATMMNKGLEVIEACWLFDATPQQVQVVVHPQSIIHSMVEYSDGSILAQLGNPDMRTPIAHALAWPRRMSSGVSSLDLFQLGRLDFQAPDYKRFPCLRLAFEALERGGTAPAILNAANEIAVQAFLERRIRFSHIPAIIETTLERVTVQAAASLPTILESDSSARHKAAEQVSRLGQEIDR